MSKKRKSAGTLLVMGALAASTPVFAGETARHAAVPPTAPAAPAPSSPQPKPQNLAPVIPTVPVVATHFPARLAELCEALGHSRELNDPKKRQDFNANAVEDCLRKRTGNANLAFMMKSVAETCRSLAAPAPWRLTEEDLRRLRALRGLPDLGLLVRAVSAVAEQPEATIDDIVAVMTQELAKPGKFESAAPSPLTGLQGLESTAINGLADFLVTRSKQEALAYLKERFTDHYCNPSDAENLSRFIPATCATLQSADPMMSIGAIGITLRASAIKDIELAPDGFLAIGGEQAPRGLYAFEFSRMAYAVFRAASQGRDPSEVFDSLHGTALRACETSPTDADGRNCQQLLRALRWASALSYVIKAEKMTQGALLTGPSSIGSVLTAEARLEDLRLPLSAAEATSLVDVMSFLVVSHTNWQKDVEQLSAVSGTERRRLLALFVLDVIRDGTQAVTAIASAWPTEGYTDRVRKACSYLEPASAAGSALLQEDYGTAASEVSILFAQFVQDRFVVAANERDLDAMRMLGKVTPFLAEVANAKSSNEVATTLESAAAPVGSYKLKYQRPTVSINAFVGGLGGTELMRTPAVGGANAETTRSPMIAGFAPVGIHATLPFDPSESGGYSFHVGALVSVIDVGALTTARFTTEVNTSPDATQRTSASPNVGVGQIFSPGVYLTLGLFKTPLLIGGGASLGPGLRTVDTTTKSTGAVESDNISTVRIGGFVAMDLTLLPF